MSPAPPPSAAVAKRLDFDVCLGLTLARPRETDEVDGAFTSENPRNDGAVAAALGTRACTEEHLLPSKIPATRHTGAAAEEEGAGFICRLLG